MGAMTRRALSPQGAAAAFLGVEGLPFLGPSRQDGAGLRLLGLLPLPGRTRAAGTGCIAGAGGCWGGQRPGWGGCALSEGAAPLLMVDAAFL